LARAKRGVSEIFSALLIIMITLAVGLTVYLAAVDYLSAQESATANELLRAQRSATENLVIVRAYIEKEGNNGYLWLVVATSSGGATIYGVYVDGSPAPPENFSLPLKLGPNKLIMVGPFRSPTISTGSHVVTVSTDYGSATGYAEVISR
jgi:flagellin-like protein